MKTIIVEVQADGSITVEAVGFKGQACEQATKAIEQALGVVTGRKRKTEYWQSCVNQSCQQKVGQQ